MKPVDIMIGYDPREPICYHVLCHSILSRSSVPIRIVPVNLRNLRSIYDRPANPSQTTEFTFARFLTPYLAESPVSVFMDSDMLCLCDIKELISLAFDQPSVDVLCVKHDYVPKAGRKFLNQEQSVYPCKNWSSLMIFNGWRMAVRRLTPEYVNSASPMDLHQFKWASAVGEIPAEYNHLVGEYPHNKNARIVHYTLGAPCFRQYQNCEYSEEWFVELGRMTHCDDPALGEIGAYLSRNADPDNERHTEPFGVLDTGEQRDSGDDPQVPA